MVTPEPILKAVPLRTCVKQCQCVMSLAVHTHVHSRGYVDKIKKCDLLHGQMRSLLPAEMRDFIKILSLWTDALSLLAEKLSDSWDCDFKPAQ